MRFESWPLNLWDRWEPLSPLLITDNLTAHFGFAFELTPVRELYSRVKWGGWSIITFNQFTISIYLVFHSKERYPKTPFLLALYPVEPIEVFWSWLILISAIELCVNQLDNIPKISKTEETVNRLVKRFLSWNCDWQRQRGGVQEGAVWQERLARVGSAKGTFKTLISKRHNFELNY